jgi:hypothetical protein
MPTTMFTDIPKEILSRMAELERIDFLNRADCFVKAVLAG